MNKTNAKSNAADFFTPPFSYLLQHDAARGLSLLKREKRGASGCFEDIVDPLAR